jgi:hypothetical protein
MLLSSASLVLACVACGEGLQAADRDQRRPVEVDPALRAERARLSREISAHREALAALDAELRELDDKLVSSPPGERFSPENEAWRARQQELRAEALRRRGELEVRVEEIAELWRSKVETGGPGT